MSSNIYDKVNKVLIPYAGNAEVVMEGATSESDGKGGLIPSPLAGDELLFLKGNGAWDKPVWTGTVAEWESLTDNQKAEYEIVTFTDDIVGGGICVEDAITEDSLNPITSGAVYEALEGDGGYESRITALEDQNGTATPTTTAQTLSGAVNELNSNKQPKTLDTSIVVGGVTATTVEGALGTLNTKKADSATTIAGYGITNAYTKTEIDNLFSEHESNISWKTAVATYSDIATTYPNPQPGWTVVTNDTNIAYRYTSDEGWVAISANATPIATDQVDGLMSTTMVTKLSSIEAGAEVNQNAFGSIVVDGTTVAADAKTDSVEFVAGTNVSITADAINDTVTISATDTTYTSQTAAEGGTDVSLVTTGEKYIWDHKKDDIEDNFVGTQQAWDALTVAQKAQYKTVDITNSFDGYSVDHTPTVGSPNLVTSNGIALAEATKYDETDTTDTAIDVADYIPFYDSSANAKKKITLGDMSLANDIMIAGTEETSTASQAYTVGQYLIYNKTLYRVIDAIVQDDTLEVGTNIVSAKVADEITSIHNNLTASNVTAGVTDVPFRFGCDDDGNFGYIITEGGADTVVPFKSGGGVEIIKVGSLSGSSSQTINCTAVSDYQSLTIDNFWFKALRHSAYGWGRGSGGSGSASANINLSYNATTGILTVTGCYIEGLGYDAGSVDGRGRSWVYGDVYVIR